MELNYGDGNTRVQQPEEQRELNLGDGITKVKEMGILEFDQTRETQGTELRRNTGHLIKNALKSACEI